MALTVSVVRRNVVGSQKVVIADVTFDNSYPTGGEAFTPADVDPGESTSSTFDFVDIHQNDATVADYRLVAYDHTNAKLMVITTLSSGANAQAANASDQSAVTVRTQCWYGGAVR